MAASYICNRIPHSALNMKTPYKKLSGKDAELSHLKIIGARAFVHIKNPNKLGHTSWEGMVSGFSETRRNCYSIWNPKTRRVVESRNVVFIETLPNLLASHRRTISATTRSMTTTSRTTTYCGTCGINPPLWILVSTHLPETVKVLLPQKASAGVTSPGEAPPAGISTGGVTPKGSSSPPAPTPASAAPRATNGHANRGTVRVNPTVTRSREASLSPVPVATRYGGGRNNNRATLAELFEAGTLQSSSELEPGSPSYTEDIAHQTKNASFNVEYAYVAINALGSFRGGENKEQIPNAFKKTMTLPQTGRWKVASDKEIASLKKHGVYELVPIT